MFTSGCTCHTIICCSELYDTSSTNVDIVFVLKLPKLAVTPPSMYPTFYRAGTLLNLIIHMLVWENLPPSGWYCLVCHLKIMLRILEKVDGKRESESVAVIHNGTNLLSTNKDTHVFGNNILYQEVLFASLRRHCKTAFLVRFEQSDQL